MAYMVEKGNDHYHYEETIQGRRRGGDGDGCNFSHVDHPHTVACQSNLKGTLSNSLWKSFQMDPKVIFLNDSIQLLTQL